MPSFVAISTFALALAASVSALPSGDKSPFNIVISGLPKTQYSGFESTNYLAYQPDFFGSLGLGVTSNKSAAIAFDILGNGTLKSTTGQTLAVTPLEYNTYTGSDDEVGDVNYVAYTGTEGTYVSKHHEILNSYANFSSWQVATSQYGAYINFVSPAWNQTAANNGGYPFPAYAVKFHARR